MRPESSSKIGEWRETLSTVLALVGERDEMQHQQRKMRV